MGMYDCIICRYPLPTKPPSWAADDDQRYQSKSLDCMGATYEIGADGKLRQCEAGFFEAEFDASPIRFHGVLEFYDSNWGSVAYGMTFTPDGADYESVTYAARFVDGTVEEITETERERKPALSLEVYDQVNTLFQEDRPVIDVSEPEVGSEMYALWGSINRNLDGYPVKLIAKTSHDWAFVGPGDKIETIDPSQLGNCLFHSEADAKAQRGWEHRVLDRQTEYCKNLLERLKHHNE